MGAQEFNTVDVVRLEVETNPVGLSNLVENPSGELGGWGWITTLANSTMSGIAGPLLQYTRTVGGASSFTTEALPISAAQYAAARWEAVAGSGVTHVRARFEWLNAAGALLSSSAQTGYFSATTTAGLLSPVVAPASTAYVRLRFDLYASNTGTNPGGSHWIKLHEVTVAKAATSGAFGTFRTNLVPNPSLEVNTTGWTGSAYVTVSRSTAQAYSGTASAKGTLSTAQTSARLGPPGGTGSSGAVVGGATYSARARVRLPVAGNARLLINWWTGPGIFVSQVVGSSVAVAANAWTAVGFDAVVAPANAVYVSMQIEVDHNGAAMLGDFAFVDALIIERASTVGTYFDGSTPDAGGWDYGWSGTAHASPSTATNSTLGYLPPVEYLNIIGDSHEIRVPRAELNVGSLSATVLSRSLDPSQSDLLRPGRRARLSALVAGTWQTIIGGKLLEADVTYDVKDPKVPAEKQARISVVLVDPTQTVANAGRPEGVATIAELPYVLEGAGVPWNVNGSGNQVTAATVTTYNENASALNQVVLTRDTVIGYAWMSRLGVLNVWDRGVIASGSPVVLDEDDYCDIDLSFSTKDCINEVQITVQGVDVDGGTSETVYPLYEDAASIAEWGRYRKEFTVTGLDAAGVDALAAAILAAASTPRIRVNSLTIPMTTVARMEAHATRDLYDEVRVQLAELGVDEVLRIRGLEHIITTDKWLLRLDFADEGGVAIPTKQPPVQSNGKTLSQLLRPVGEVTMWFGAKANCPAGWLVLDGSSFDGAKYPDLQTLLASTTLPDFTDRFPIGAGTKALGTGGGAATRALTAANLPPHAHDMTHTHTVAVRNGATAFGAAGAAATPSVTGSLNTITTQSQSASSTGNGPGTSTAVDILNPWRALWFIIRAA